MKNLLLNKNGFIPLENLVILNIATLIGSMAGVPFVSMLVGPSLFLTLYAASYNVFKHCEVGKKDALFTDVINSDEVNNMRNESDNFKRFNLSSSNTSSIIGFIKQLGRLTTPEGKLFDLGSKASWASSLGAWMARVTPNISGTDNPRFGG